MSKYDPLRFHLTELKQKEWHATFKQLEEILGFTLPATARARPQWWANEEDGQHTQAKS